MIPRHGFNPEAYYTEPSGQEKLKKEVEKWKAMRELILEKIPSVEDGLNLKGAKKFLQGLNIPIKDHIFTDQKGLESFNTLSSKHKFHPYLIGKFWLGAYFEELSMVIINRSRCHEDTDGPEVSEGIYIHEQAHSLNGYKHCVVEDKKVELSRIGLAVGPYQEERGIFLEEGLVDMIRAKYIEKNSSPKLKTAAFSHSEKERRDPNSKLLYTYTPDKNSRGPHKSTFTFPMPIKYLYRASRYGRLDYIPSALAGFGMELLCKKSPELFETLLRARTNVEALRQVPQILNSLSPNLYPRLRSLKYTEKDFLEGLKIILEEVDKKSPESYL